MIATDTVVSKVERVSTRKRKRKDNKSIAIVEYRSVVVLIELSSLEDRTQQNKSIERNHNTTDLIDASEKKTYKLQ